MPLILDSSGYRGNNKNHKHNNIVDKLGISDEI